MRAGAENTSASNEPQRGRGKHRDEACKLYAAVVHYIISDTAATGSEEKGHQIARIDELLAGTRYDLNFITKKNRDYGANPTGYVVDSLDCALYAFWDRSASFEEAVAWAANQGGDADTIAAICGGLAGAYYGFDAIPEEWIAALSAADRKRLDAAVEAAVANWTK